MKIKKLVISLCLVLAVLMMSSVAIHSAAGCSVSNECGTCWSQGCSSGYCAGGSGWLQCGCAELGTIRVECGAM